MTARKLLIEHFMMLRAQNVTQVSRFLEDPRSGSTIVKLERARPEVEANVWGRMIERQLRDPVRFRRCIPIDHRWLRVGS